ncbi:MAG: 4-demethylwyosine synthase TYW1 [Methanomassiliicoccales archaeon]|nr:4-demethylwyosine synthase TYW1 [Methanomassiliicoccales archaeon]
MRSELLAILEKQQYKVFREHAAVKLCHWVRESLLRNRFCYKQEFYGIKSHRCLQMTPVVNMCTQSCLFCWRVQGFESFPASWCDPEEMLDALIEQQRFLVSGFKGDKRCEINRWQEAREPKHIAISLAGEPTLYPFLSEFIEVCHKRGLTTFLVTNGTKPEVLEKLDPLPTQLYVTVAAPNEEIYRKLCVPKIPDGWERLMATLKLLPSLNTRTVIRHTLVQDWNLGWEEEYARLDEIADPTFIEPKGYVFVGQSRERMSLTNMPSHASIRDFGMRLGNLLGLEILKEKEDSRVVLLGEKERETIIPGVE